MLKWYIVENYNDRWDYNRQRKEIPLPRYGEDVIIKNEGETFVGHIARNIRGNPVVIDISNGYQRTIFRNGLKWAYFNNELEYLTPYTVTKGNTDGCIKVGDII